MLGSQSFTPVIPALDGEKACSTLGKGSVGVLAFLRSAREKVENAVALIARFGVRFTPHQTLMPEFDQSPFHTNKSRHHRGPAPYIAGL
jgi:hypothetical protein